MEQQFLSSATEESLTTKKVLSVIATIFPIFCWVPYVVDSKSRFCRHFCNQTLLLLISNIVFSVIISIISLATSTTSLMAILSNSDLSLLVTCIPLLITMGLTMIFNIFIFILKIMNIINIANANCADLPLIGKIHIVK